MNVKNFLLIASMLFAAFSCSMEDELINDIDKAKKNNEPARAGQAAISLHIDMPKSIATRAAEGYADPTDAERTIDHCSLILIDGEGKVIKAIDDASVKVATGTVYKGSNDADNLTAFDTVKFIVKVGDAKDYKVMVIANSSIKFAGFTTLAQIQDKIQTSAEYGKFVKVGTGNVVIDSNWNGYPGYTTIEEAQTGDAVNVQVELTQLEARIEVASFEIKGFNSLSVPQDVLLKKIEIANLYTQSFTDKDAQVTQTPPENYYTTKSFTYSAAGEEQIYIYKAALGAANVPYTFTDLNKPVCYSFRNTNGEFPVAVRLYYTVGGEERKTKVIVINQVDDDPGSVIGGNLYRLKVTMDALNYDDIEVSVKCYTLDWEFNKLSYIF